MARESIMIFSIPVRREIVRTAELVHILEFSFLINLFKVFWKGSFRMSFPNLDFSRTQFYVIFSTSYVIFEPWFGRLHPNQNEVILTILKLNDDSLDLLANQKIRNNFHFGSLETFENKWVIFRRCDVTATKHYVFENSYQSFDDDFFESSNG